VAYGDSLTAGAPAMESYAASLADALASAGCAVEMTVCGLCGVTAYQMLASATEPAIADIQGRSAPGLLNLAKARRGAWRAADLVLIMSGTNDLGTPARADDIFAYIRGLHQDCLSAGIPTVALAIPDQGERRTQDRGLHVRNEAHTARRQAVNGKLAAWVRERGSDRIGKAPKATLYEETGGGGVASLDAYLAALDAEEETPAAALPARPELFVNTAGLLPNGPQSLAAGLWEKDGVHFTAAGSRLLGQRLALVLQPLVAKLCSKGAIGRSAELGAEGDSALPSLDAYLAAFDLEEEDEVEDKGHVPGEEPEEVVPEWKVKVAVKLQLGLQRLMAARLPS